VTDLNHLSRVNKSLRDHIHHSIHEHWRRIGREICGSAYWNEALFAPSADGRYTAKLHLCPWLSAPERFELRTLQAYNEMDAAVALQSLKVCPALVQQPNESELHLHIHVHESLHAKGGPRLIIRCARAGEASDSLCMPSEDAAENEDYTDDVLLAIDLQVHLQSDPAFMRFARRYGLGELACVRIVHARMFAAIFDEGRAWRHSTILFISMDDHTRILHDFRFIDGVPAGRPRAGPPPVSCSSPWLRPPPPRPPARGARTPAGSSGTSHRRAGSTPRAALGPASAARPRAPHAPLPPQEEDHSAAATGAPPACAARPRSQAAAGA
jgi:hypothetical protein